MFGVRFFEDDSRRAVETFLAEWRDEREFIVAHTSGSTGKPKEIRLPKRDMLVSAVATNRRFGIVAESRLLCPLSVNYIAGKMMLVRALEADCEVAFCKPSNDFWHNKAVVEYIADGVVDLLPIVPSQGEVLLSNPPAYLYRIRNVIIGGAALSAETEPQLLSIAPNSLCLFATYGMTETCSHVALRRLGDSRFSAMPGITFSVDSRQCLSIIAPEYSFGSLQTNDIVDLVSATEFMWHGRADNVINSGGVKIFPEELERKLADKIPGRFYFVGVEDAKWGRSVTLVVEADNPLPDEILYEICSENLSIYERPKAIMRIQEIPLTPNGKLRRITPK